MGKSQEFNGKTYYLYNGESYFSRGTKRLHRVVWEFYNGKIPKRFHIHHIDGNKENNSIENLQIIEGKEHSSTHSTIFHSLNPDFARKNIEKNQDKCREWHASKEGIEWHKQQAAKFNFGHLTYGKRECEICSSEFTAKNISQKFCSNNCKSEYRRRTGVDNEKRICKNCNSEFEINKYSKTENCSRKCAGIQARKGI